MSKTVPQLRKTIHHLIGPAAQFGVHKTPLETKFLRHGFTAAHFSWTDGQLIKAFKGRLTHIA